jgi:hypothetical protein
LAATIRDPELRKLVDDPDVTLELWAEDERGETRELPLSVHDDWSRVTHFLDEAEETVEVGIAKNHRGGRRRSSR